MVTDPVAARSILDCRAAGVAGLPRPVRRAAIGPGVAPLTPQDPVRQSNEASARCAACGSQALFPHLRVAGDPGREALIPTSKRFGTALADIVRCQACGHMQLAEIPQQATLVNRYADAESADYLAEKAGQRATSRTTLDALDRHVGVGALLDVGCWVGFMLDEARLRGWRTVGLEPSTFASAYARDSLGLDVQTADLFGAELPAGSFDAVLLADVLEHLPDPGEALDAIAGLTVPGGVLLLALPDAGSQVARVMGGRWWSVIPTHVHYFTRRSLSTLLTRRRWEVLEIGTAPKAFTVRYYLDRVGGYSERLSRALVNLAGAAGVADRIWAPDFRDRMRVVARAPGPSTG